MKNLYRLFLTVVLVSFGFAAYAQNQEGNEMPTPEELATQEADRLAEQLKLESWQVFYVDSTLQHDYAALMQEAEKMQKSKVGNAALYQAMNDRWADQIDATYKRIFTPEQWASYLKSGAGKAQKARQKRAEKAAALAEKTKK